MVKHGKHNDAKAKKRAENPFDKFANNRTKHEVVNRRVKGGERDQAKALEKSIAVRKSRLLLDYQSNKRSNLFKDR